MKEELNKDEIALSDQELEEIVQNVEKLEPRQKEIVLERLEIYQGDLPHPNILKGYNELYPEAAKLIIENGIKESEHRRIMEHKFLDSKTKEVKLGQYLGFILALIMTITGALLIYKGHKIEGSILSGIMALSIIGLFTGSNKRDENK